MAERQNFFTVAAEKAMLDISEIQKDCAESL